MGRTLAAQVVPVLHQRAGALEGDEGVLHTHVRGQQFGAQQQQRRLLGRLVQVCPARARGGGPLSRSKWDNLEP